MWTECEGKTQTNGEINSDHTQQQHNMDRFGSNTESERNRVSKEKNAPNTDETYIFSSLLSHAVG